MALMAVSQSCLTSTYGRLLERPRPLRAGLVPQVVDPNLVSRLEIGKGDALDRAMAVNKVIIRREMVILWALECTAKSFFAGDMDIDATDRYASSEHEQMGCQGVLVSY